MFDYETLRFIWWLLIGVILVVFMISDGFDMGIGCLLPLVARNDDERRIVINSVGAHWEGNQVWLILAGGALFAAWPRVYAAAFSGFYVAMILVLCSLFFRPLAFDYRGKIADARWRKMWDAGLVIGSLVPPVVFGIAFGNLLLGVPFAFTPQLRVEYLGSFWQLLTPFPLLCGLLSLGMVILQGGVWLQLKTVGVIHLRSQLATKRAALLVMLCFLLAGYWLWVGIDGFVLLAQDANGPSNPLMKLVAVLPGAWMNNFVESPVLWIFPLLGFFCPLLTVMAIYDGVIDAIWRDFHGRHHAVPLRHAVKRESDLQPDVVGQHFQPADAEHYVGNRADIFAHCVALHSLELLQNVGAHDNRNSPP